MAWGKEQGWLLQRARKEKGLRGEDVAEKVHRSKQAVSSWETGKVEPDVDIKDQLAALLDLSRAALDCTIQGAPFPALGGAGQFGPGITDTAGAYGRKLASAPVVGTIGQTAPGAWGAIVIDATAVRTELYALEVTDNSLQPVAGTGSRLIVDPAERPRDGDLVLADLPGGARTLGVLRRAEGLLSLASVRDATVCEHLDPTACDCQVVRLIDRRAGAPWPEA